MKRFFVLLLILSSAAAFCPAANPQVTLNISGGVTGSIVIELYLDEAPITVVNFLNYVASGFYDGLIFHRVIYGFMIQGGGYDPDLVKKPGGPEIINESSNRLSHSHGTIAMARSTYADTATSEFFINAADNTFLDFGSIISDPAYNHHAVIGYCVFGQVINGMDVVDAIAAVATTTENGYTNVPVVDIIINASISLNEPVCLEKMIGDIDGDCDVDTEDMFRLAAQWLSKKCDSCYSADISNDGYVNFSDYAKMAMNWLKCNSVTGICD